MRAAGVILATVVALTLQTVLGRFLIRGTVAVDLVLVVVVYAALLFGPVTGLLTGTWAGLIQDYLSTGVVGIGALAKTVVGFIAGIIGGSSSSPSRCRGWWCFSPRRWCTR